MHIASAAQVFQQKGRAVASRLASILRCLAQRPKAVLTYSALVAIGVVLSHVLPGWAVRELGASGDTVVIGMLVGVIAVYVLMSAAPFVPGAEIGFALLAIFGAKIALIVYGAMVAALTLSFMAGWFVPKPVLASFLDRIGCKRLSAFVGSSTMAHCPPAFVRRKHLALAVLLNTPGNSLLGGGGGIAFAAGASRLYSPVAFMTTIIVAVAPVPLAFVLFCMLS